MRAVQLKEFGGPEVLIPAEHPDPVPGPGEVVIDVAYVDTIFVETQIRAGRGRDHFPVTPPYVPGGGVSGVVRVVGAGVPAEWLGRRVSSFVTGSCAERAVAPVSALTAVPDPLDLLPAAALVHDGVTALGLLGLTALGETDRVLALGASGGMGTLLVQPTQARGARVIAVARGEEKLALVRELGGGRGGRRHPGRLGGVRPPRTRREIEGADVVLDGVGGALGAAALSLTADGGRFSAHGAASGGFAPARHGGRRPPRDRTLRHRGRPVRSGGPQPPHVRGPHDGRDGETATGDRRGVPPGTGRGGACGDRGAGVGGEGDVEGVRERGLGMSSTSRHPVPSVPGDGSVAFRPRSVAASTASPPASTDRRDACSIWRRRPWSPHLPAWTRR